MQISFRRTMIVFALSSTLLVARAEAAGDFDGLSCDQADLAKPMVGRKLTNATIPVLEEKYKPLALKAGGADMLEEGNLSAFVFWRLCNRNLVLLVDKKDRVADAVQFEATGHEPTDDFCTSKDKQQLLVLRKFNAAGAAEQAWRLDVKTKKLVSIPLDGLVCPDK